MPDRILYDIANHNDFEDSITIMEQTKDEEFDLIYMEMPRRMQESLSVYEPSAYRSEQNLKHSFVKRCILNAYRLLKPDGILVFIAPRDNESNLNYYFPLCQLFPSIFDVVYSHGDKDWSNVDTFYLCSKKEHFSFHYLRNTEGDLFYEHWSPKGIFGIRKLIQPKASFFTMFWDYKWNGIKPTKGKGWIVPIERLQGLYDQGDLFFKRNRPYEKVYYYGNAVTAHSPLRRKIPDKINSKLHCDSDFIDFLLFSYCGRRAKVFCPFDYDGIFPKVATERDLHWTSVRIHFPYSYKKYWEFPNRDYTKFLDLRPSHAKTYNEELLISPSEIPKIKEKLAKQSMLEIKQKEKVIPVIDMVKTGEKLTKLREDQKLYPHDVTAKLESAGLGISRQTLYNWEHGITPVTLQGFLALASIYSITDLEDMLSLVYPEEENK